ncbi:MAG: carboxypeptidase regulatory-like domain-containing protein, partial [Acidobacteria bacterium]|nr:carboxypeptidase regulatory-like domain-containing protein [Acidobacteriota bacterium]
MDGNLIGIVSDASGAAVGKATITIENIATGVKSSTTSSEIGAYRFNNVLAGNYKLTAMMTGFTAFGINNVRIETNKTAAINVTL